MTNSLRRDVFLAAARERSQGLYMLLLLSYSGQSMDLWEHDVGVNIGDWPFHFGDVW